MADRPTGAAHDGFTFVEVVVVMVILSILAAIAIATYLDQVRKADRAAAIAALGDLPVIAETLTADNDDASYVDDQSAYEQQLRVDFLDGSAESTAPDEISVLAAGDGTWVSFAVDGREHCYYLRLERTGNRRVEHREPRQSVGCSADEFDPSNPGQDGWGG